jgi:hypothetical protein
VTIFLARKIAFLWSLRGLAVAFLAACLTLAFTHPAQAAFGIERFENAIVASQGGPPATQAGSHPYAMTTTIVFNHHETEESGPLPDGDAKNIEVNLPPGLIANPSATATKCTEAGIENSSVGCPNSAAVGVAIVSLNIGGLTEARAPVFDMVPPPGVPAEFGFNAVGFGLIVHIAGKVRTGGDYGLSANVSNITQKVPLLSAALTLWGDPSDPRHDTERGTCAFHTEEETNREKEELKQEEREVEEGTKSKVGKSYGFGNCPTERVNRPFLTMPGSCASEELTTTMNADSWQEATKFVSASAISPRVIGCERLDFSPLIAVKPDTAAADSPSGLSVDLKVPQEEGLSGLAEANLKEAVVTLPAGMAVSPSAANGLGACTLEEIGLDNAEKPACPDASKVGAAEVETPLLEAPLKGSVYLAQQGENPFGSLLALYLVAEGSGALIKLAGHVEADLNTGQLTTTFQNNPQLPFRDLKLKFFGGPRAPLITPPACGTYETKSSLTPWSGTPAMTSSDTFGIASGCGGGFAPSFSAGASNNQAGAFSPFSVTFSRQDGEQRLGGITVQMPPGLLGKIAGVPLCGEAQANAGTCPAASQIGATTVGAGPGPDPFYVPEAGQPANPVYLTGPYKGAPFGLSIVTHALAGPFDLGNVIVRAAINIDPHTAQITVTSDPLPTILQGIPLDLRTANVTVNRAGFMFNPTDCSPMSVGGTITSTQGASAGVSSPFESANCATLPFNPKFTVLTQARTSKAGGAYLHVKVTSGPGQANIGKVKVDLPKQLPSRLTTLQKACIAALFETNPANCPAGSVVGTGTAVTPVLKNILTGPAYLVSHGGAAFPDLEIVLQGEGITLDLVGNTDIKKGITSSTFKSVPDAPISTFDLVLPEGPHSVLAAYLPAKAKYSMCGQSLAMPTEITGQNGAVVKQTTKIAVTGCPKIKKAKAKQKATKRRKGRNGKKK